MRALLVATLMLIAALAGCSGKSGDDHLHVECADGKEIHEDDFEGALPENATEEDVLDFLRTKCTGSSGTRTTTRSNSTSQAPNVLPRLALNITDFGGNVTNVTMVDGNLTFSAAGSSDPDGQVSAIAISVQDSNATRTKSLYDAGSKTFTPATFSFDRPGIINVTVAMVDDRAGFNTSVFNVFVNHPQVIVGPTLDVPSQNVPGMTDACRGAAPTLGSSASIVDAAYFKAASFAVVDFASFVEVIPRANTRVTICDPAGEPISAEKVNAPVTSNNEERLPPATGIQTYSIGMYATAPRTPTGATVIVHYEPRAAAEPEA